MREILLELPMKTHLFATIFFLFGYSMPAIADLEYRRYVELEKMKAAGSAQNGAGAALLNHWLDGLATGLSWSQTAAREPGQKVFCQPARLSLSAEVLESILRQYIEAHRAVVKEDTYMGVVAILAMRETFPCEK